MIILRKNSVFTDGCSTYFLNLAHVEWAHVWIFTHISGGKPNFRRERGGGRGHVFAHDGAGRFNEGG